MIRFEIPGAPPLKLNARMHWAQKAKLAKQWKKHVYEATLGRAPATPYKRAIVRYVRHCGYKRPDHDNLVSGFKWVQDGLVEAKIISDDTMENIETYHEWRKARPSEKRIEVEIVEIVE